MARRHSGSRPPPQWMEEYLNSWCPQCKVHIPASQKKHAQTPNSWGTKVFHSVCGGPIEDRKVQVVTCSVQDCNSARLSEEDPAAKDAMGNVIAERIAWHNNGRRTAETWSRFEVKRTEVCPHHREDRLRPSE